MKKKSNKKFIFLGGALCLLVLAVLFVAKYHFKISFVKTKSAATVQQESFSDMAKRIVQKCSSIAYKPTCYEDEVPKLMDKISMVDAFEVTKLIQQDDPSYGYCHVLGHKLAEIQTAKDPSKWLDVVDMCPDGVCSNGCIHGAFQQKFREESLTPDQTDAFIKQISDVCEKRASWNPTGLEQATCYHALGHLLMYATKADVQTASSICDLEAVKDSGQRDYRKLCYDGVFMQIFQPLEADDIALVAGKSPDKAGLAAYCAKFSALKETSCWSEGWPLYRAEIMTPKGVVAFCAHLKGQTAQGSCYTDMFYVVTAQVQFDVAQMKTYCGGLPQGVMGRCFANTASRLIETDYQNISKSTDVCQSAPVGPAQDSCFNELLLYSTYNFHAGSQEFYRICNAMDEPWKGQCLQQKKQ